MGSLTLCFGWQSVAQASSISARVNVFETKLSQFERQMNELKAQQVNQIQTSEDNEARIKSIVSRLNMLEDQMNYTSPSSSTGRYTIPAGQAHYSNSYSNTYSNRFTDRLYTYP
ncbi:hypothetical protein [Thiomicrospira microaerophila]|uniref:hypothetical protein n=1 Tax=Thiomicrospira microaerophila TaxID=406020 RepID=UPI0012FD3857|nr:hypothetical protein [Thiomicrospira microaerophila]